MSHRVRQSIGTGVFFGIALVLAGIGLWFVQDYFTPSLDQSAGTYVMIATTFLGAAAGFALVGMGHARDRATWRLAGSVAAYVPWLPIAVHLGPSSIAVLAVLTVEMFLAARQLKRRRVTRAGVPPAP